MKLSLILILSVFCVTANAESWQCRNDMEIHCAEGKCETAEKDSFTPMSVSFSDNGKMNVCAYSGCWEGTGKVFEDGNFMMLSGQSLKFSTSNSVMARENIAITFDRSDNIGMLKFADFAHPLICKKGTANIEEPKFADYKVKVSKAKPKSIVFRGNKDARMFRTRLRDARKGGVNFAGHFIFTTWGCGTSCAYGAIINTKTGRVYFPKEVAGMSFGMMPDLPDQPIQYRKNSQLLVIHGNTADSEKAGVTHLVWQGTKFKKIKFVAAKR